MGYSTNFTGELLFNSELTVPQLRKVKSFMAKDCREHPEWDAVNLSYIDLELLDDFSGIKWDGSEKTYDMVDKVNLITREMRKEFPEFGFKGHLRAQGEDHDDTWILWIGVDGVATENKVPLPEGTVKCPECGHGFSTLK